MRKVDNLPLSCAVVTKSGILNFLEPSESLQACNGTALPYLIVIHILCTNTHFISLHINCPLSTFIYATPEDGTIAETYSKTVGPKRIHKSKSCI